ncbi:MAG TPA: hypothetical protein VIC08_11375 [Cellvibrionaceae bacterium]
MTDVFIIQNQDRLFLGKQGALLDGREPAALYRSVHKDEAINEMVEATARDHTQRLQILTCSLNDKGLPMLDADILPPPLPDERKTRALDFEASADQPSATDTAPESAPSYTTQAQHN